METVLVIVGAVVGAVVTVIAEHFLKTGLPKLGLLSRDLQLVQGKWYGKALQPIGPRSENKKIIPELYDFDMELNPKMFYKNRFEGTGSLSFEGRTISLVLKGEVKRNDHILIHYYDKDNRVERYGTFILKLTWGRSQEKVAPSQQFKGEFLAYATEMNDHSTGHPPIVGGQIFLSRKEHEARNHTFSQPKI